MKIIKLGKIHENYVGNIFQKTRRRRKILLIPKKGPHFILVEESGTNTQTNSRKKIRNILPKTVPIKQMKIYIISMKPIE